MKELPGQAFENVN